MARDPWDFKVTRQRNMLFAFLSVALFFTLGFLVYRENSQEWKETQVTYHEKLAVKLNKPELRNTPIQVKQVWLPKLQDATDRCPTCHLAVENPMFADEPQPLTTHPGEYLKNHPTEKFGCTICHQGDGLMVQAEKTHGAVHHLNSQLLAKEYVQASCTKCHTDLYDQAVTPEIFPEAAAFITGRNLSHQFGCRACHTIQGTGGNLGPELSYFGSRGELAFLLIHDFSHVEGHHTMANWEYEHFLNPQKIVPGDPILKIPPTIMPNFNLKPDQAKALTIYVLGLKNPKVESILTEYLPQKRILEVRAAQPDLKKTPAP